MITCYLGLGSNLQSPERTLRMAIGAIKKLPSSHLVKCSELYWSKPWGLRAQPDFCNLVLELRTHLPPLQLLNHCQAIETAFGRIRKKRWGPRTLDVDILYYGQLSMISPRLSIPHPYALERDFVLKPLLSISPEFKLANGQNLSNFLALCPNHLKACL